VVGPTRVRFRVPDPDASLQEVRLYQEVRRPRVWPGFARVAATATWELDFPRPAVDRMEYQLQLRYPGAGPVLVPDPANPLRASGPFGDTSVVEFPGYRPPAWLAGQGGRPATAPPTTGLAVPSRVLGARVPVQLWRSHGSRARPGERLPLLVVHDGPEYARYAALLQFLDWATAGGRLPPMRAALLAPVDRNEHYSASPAWSRALVSEVLPAIEALAPTPPGRRFLVGMGASLGALAVLAAARTAPASFGGLFLQSGSFFRPGVDDLERHFPRYRRICRFVDDLAAGRGLGEPATAVLTCGTVEENLHGNRVVHAALAAAGWQVTLAEHRDAHNWVAWRDTVDPWLLGLLQELWKGRA
jgi:enterochelin esterase-like enzyme